MAWFNWTLFSAGSTATAAAINALFTRAAVRLLGWLGGEKKMLHHLPGASGWTKGRDMPAPSGRTFRELYQARRSP